MPSMRTGGRHGRRLKADINVVPYIDVMLVLLVIFMVTAPLITPGLIELPSVGQAAEVPAKPLEVQINSQGKIALRMVRNADIVLDEKKGVLAIREALVQYDNGKPFVEVETAPQTFVRRDVKLGLSDGIKVEVLGGVTKADRIKIPETAGPPGTGHGPPRGK